MRLFALITLLTSTILGFTADKVFRAGAATSNVTPWLGVSMPGGFTDRRATKIHDELHARCLVLDVDRLPTNIWHPIFIGIYLTKN